MKYTHWRKSDGWFYLIFHPAVERVMYAAYSKIYLYGLEKLPTDRPVLLAANHPTAFSEAILLCIFLDTPIYNMARGDVFQHPFYRRLLYQINMFPVFRHRDGFTDRDRNTEVFEYCFRQLKKRRTLTIYVEGEHHLDKQVKPVQKGIVRIAFGALERENLENLTIVPIGVNYCSGVHLPDEVMINIGDPIAVQPFFDKLKSGDNNAIAECTSTIWHGLEAVCFHLENRDDETLADQVLTLHRSQNKMPLLPIVVRNDLRFHREKQLLQTINHLSAAQKNRWKDAANHYFQRLAAAGVQDFALVQPGWGHFFYTILLWITFPIFLVGYITTRPIAWAVQLSLKKVKKREFISSVKLGVAIITALAFFSLLLIINCLLFRWWGILTTLGFLLATHYYFFYKNLYRKWWAVRQVARHPEKSTLQQLRHELIQLLHLSDKKDVQQV